MKFNAVYEHCCFRFAIYIQVLGTKQPSAAAEQRSFS